jgi:3-oxoacyl-[acyl-carrier protein] reductase
VTKKAYGKLDILVNNAGVYEFAPLEAITSDPMHKLFNLDVFGLIHTTQEAVKLMELGGGSIINIGSIVGAMPAPQASVYSATKAAVDAISASLSQEPGPRKIRVNSLDPGMVETEGLRASGLSEGAFRESRRGKLLWDESLNRTTLLQRRLPSRAMMRAGSPVK